MRVLQKGNSGDGCDLASTLFKGDLFVLSWARVNACFMSVVVTVWGFVRMYLV